MQPSKSTTRAVITTPSLEATIRARWDALQPHGRALRHTEDTAIVLA